MVLSTMNDNEKGWEAFRVYKTAIAIYDNYKDILWDKFRRGTKFPYFQRVQFVDDKSNTWILTVLCKSKREMKKGHFWCFCYTVYEIQKKDRKNGVAKVDKNTGKGILLLDPFGIRERVNGGTSGMGMVIDIVPHAFNRYTERYLKPRGLQNIEFVRKVENIILRWKHFDVLGDESSENNKDKGMLPYDVFMSNGGMLRGYIVDEVLLRFFSYISDDMMYEDQKEWQDEMNSEYFRWINNGIIEATKIKDI